MKVSYDTRIIDPSILKLWPEGNYEPLNFCIQHVIEFGARKILFNYAKHFMRALGSDN